MKAYLVNPSYVRIFMRSILSPALQIQLTLAIGFFLTGIVSVFYTLTPNPYPHEESLIPLGFSVLSTLLFSIGYFMQRVDPPKQNISLRRGSWIVLVAWLIAIATSGLYFVAMQVPVPGHAGEFGFWRMFIDGLYESLSGFTTTGATILPSVEAFPHSMLFWRGLTHWLGGMGIAYLGVTIWKNFKSSREAVINSESESPDIVTYEHNDQARTSGLDFLKAYGALTVVLVSLLLVSGYFFRTTPYVTWHDNAFDSVVHAMSVMGTGGFSNYDKSAGLPNEATRTHIIAGGLQNTTSEWILAIFMGFAGMNFSLWYIVLFGKKRWSILKNSELRWYWIIIIGTTLLIAYFLRVHNFYPTIEQTLRYAFFNVTTIISTTGLGNWDFVNWPVEAIGVLFVCFLVGGMVGSTAGGPKVARFIIAYKYLKQQIHNFVYGTDDDTFTIDGTEYNSKKAGLVVASISIYYLIFLIGGISLLIFSHTGTASDGSIINLDFGTSLAASIANLGNIGPAIAIGQGFNPGPTGNYYAFTIAGKIILMILMYIGRVGVLTCIMLALRTRGENRLIRSVPALKFNENAPALHQ